MARPEPNASTPCLQCAAQIRIFLSRDFDCEEFDRAISATKAVWDRGWFCSEGCREAFNVHAPENAWDRALWAMREKPKAYTRDLFRVWYCRRMRWVIGPETVEGDRFETPWETLSIPGSGLDGVLVFQPQQVSQILWIDGRTSPAREDVPDHVGLVSLRVGLEECLAVSGGVPLHAFATSGSPALVLPPLQIGVRAELTFRSWRAEPCSFEIRLRGRVARSA